MRAADFRALIATAPPGPRIELGVAKGDTLALLAEHESVTIGVDSFDGMPEPGPHDVRDGRNPYPRGRLAQPFAAVERRFAADRRVRLLKGWVPAALADLPTIPYAIVHIDLDHYAPTLAAIAWSWQRMLPGGLVICDDWIAGKDWLASKAINEWAEIRPFAGTASPTHGKAWWVR